jgi:maltose 6'-phosphate phosphatase
MIVSVTAHYGCAVQPPVNGPIFDPPGKCQDVAGRNHLNILTINVLFKEFDTRDQRLDAMAKFAVGIPVDIIFLQEVIGGALLEKGNSARDLQQKLKARGENYNLQTALETGVPELLAFGNAVLSRCEIDSKIVKRLPRATELKFRGKNIKISRNVMKVRLNIPDFGKLNVYNTHLCAACTFQEQTDQFQVLLDFVKQAESIFSVGEPHILGGDFNIDRFRTNAPESSLYNMIVNNAGFRDGYAENRNLQELCDDAAAPDKHCTVGVSELDVGDSGRRVDYIFIKEFGLNAVRESKVVFNPLVVQGQPTVSDHAGVFVSVRLRE